MLKFRQDYNNQITYLPISPLMPTFLPEILYISGAIHINNSLDIRYINP